VKDRHGNGESYGRIVVLGHSGFIGGYLTDELERRHPEADVIGRSFPEWDLTDREKVSSLAPLLDDQTALVVLSGIKKQLGDSLDTFSRNILMAVNLCRLLEQRPVGRVLFFSTADVYGEDTHNTGITEETPVRATSFYGAAKYASECLLRKTVNRHQGGSLAVIRIPFVYGPGDEAGIYGPLGFIRKAVEREPVVLWGDGTELREFVYVVDLARIACRLLFHSHDGVVNVASGESHSFRDVVEIITGLVPGGFEVGTRPRTKGKVDNVYDNRLLAGILPDFVFTDLKEGIRETFEAAVEPGKRPGAVSGEGS